MSGSTASAPPRTTARSAGASPIIRARNGLGSLFTAEARFPLLQHRPPTFAGVGARARLARGGVEIVRRDFVAELQGPLDDRLDAFQRQGRVVRDRARQS